MKSHPSGQVKPLDDYDFMTMRGNINNFVLQATNELRDYKEVWTNRAQAHIRLGKYQEAIGDCDWAQRCDENYVKAYVLEGKAYMGLKQFDKAIASYRKALKADKSKGALISGK